MFDRTCANCSEPFTTSKRKSHFCFWCTLQGITGGEPPEQADYEAARLESGTVTDENEKPLREDSQVVEDETFFDGDTYDDRGGEIEEDDY